MAHIDCSFFSQTLNKNAHVIVYIPTTSADDYLGDVKTDYFEKDKRFPTMYLLHGSYGDCMDWSRFTGVERYAQDKGIAVIMPSAENSMYLDMKHGEAYLTYVTKELPEFMSKMFPLSRKREETYVAGLSMGGYGAVRCALERPELYGYCASLSGALDRSFLKSDEPHAAKMPRSYTAAVGSDEQEGVDLAELLSEHVKKGTELPKLYMACGTKDFIFPCNESFYKKATELGVEIQYEKYPGVHNWDFWDTHIRDVINWLP